ncbi:MAG: hypothetical protein VB051_10715 [Candidatus Pelethousia sp.]|nr:hypothetical protein [Candidatus Pelethousia sp.]
MRHYTAEQFRQGGSYITDFFHEYSARVYDLAFSHTKTEQAARAITKSVFLKAINTLSVVDYDGEDYWPLLKGYVMEQSAAYLSGRPLDDAGAPAAPKATPATPAAAQTRGGARQVQGAALYGINILLSVLLVWLLLGLLARIGLFSGLDLGYSWFNQNVFLLF